MYRIMIYSNKLYKCFCPPACLALAPAPAPALAPALALAICSLPLSFFAGHNSPASGCILLFPSPGAGSISVAASFSLSLAAPLPSSLVPSQFPLLALSLCSICLLALLCLVCCCSPALPLSIFASSFCLFCALLHFIISSLRIRPVRPSAQLDRRRSGMGRSLN